MAAHAENPFARDYAEARARFLRAAPESTLASYVHPNEQGPDGEVLAIDVALVGNVTADALLIVSSGTHGVEGFCGSGCQLELLADAELQQRAIDQGVALLLIHAVNPYGFAHLRRVNEDNVDLNRNFLDFSEDRQSDTAYGLIHELLLPNDWPPDRANRAAMSAARKEMGDVAFQAALSGGQQTFPDGLFYAGRAPTWSNRIVRKILREYAAHRQRLAWIDIHTGLGPWGHGEKIFASRDNDEDLLRARAWWGADVLSIYTGDSASANVRGPMALCAHEECGGARYAAIGLEFGTLPIAPMTQALRAEHWLQRNPHAPSSLAIEIRQQMRDAFFSDDPQWQGRVLGQSRTAVLQAILGLTRP